MGVSFRRLVDDDLPMLHRWLGRPVVGLTPAGSTTEEGHGRLMVIDRTIG